MVEATPEESEDHDGIALLWANQGPCNTSGYCRINTKEQVSIHLDLNSFMTSSVKVTIRGAAWSLGARASFSEAPGHWSFLAWHPWFRTG